MLGLLYLVAGMLVLILLTSAELGPMRWAIGVPLLLLGVANLALLPRFRRDRLPPDEEFLDVDAEGHPVIGTLRCAALRRPCMRWARGCRAPRCRSRRRRWRSGWRPRPGCQARAGIAAVAHHAGAHPDPDVFMRLDQTWDSASGAGWGSVSTFAGIRIGGSVRIEIDRDGINTRSATRIPDPSLAVRAAVRQAGVRLAKPTAALVGIVNGVGCLLLTISILIGVALYL
ncbi:hypothetical protein G7085_04885 [Tessaracoccus sp. HDW20]|uniref:hypothetical protein n=1 Tax=Tessaracoccus coleopterorum TaxID=2714950 RepID=UPI0018D39ED7|nr:hypothetical protein [Tessaracoccus coleopterorum]NHB84180.1 hypothetical protein [Tessaracoccus coleopterorum]